MNDLISRSKAISVLEQLEEHSLTGKIDIFNAIYLLNNQSTAYSVANVVEELEKLKDKGSVTKAGRLITKACVDKAIEIVKQGGVADDVCEWNGERSKLVTFTRFTTNCGDNIDLQANSKLLKAFRYCPFCGKKIKIVGD